jgi:hypothetical protein
MARSGERIVVKRCVVCNVRMSKGHKKGPKPLCCSRSACKKKWAKAHGTLYPRSDPVREMELELYRLYPDAWE